MPDFLSVGKEDALKSVEEANNAENKGGILNYYELLEHFTEKIFIEQSRKIIRTGMGELKSMNFANLIIMLYNCCEPESHSVITEKKNLRLLLKNLNSICRINNLASKKLAMFIKFVIDFVSSRWSTILPNHLLLISFNPEGFQESLWIPAMNFTDNFPI
ncbi:hypothetical protein Aperf_G00000054971 [Anoplocephala perfoliata]